MPQREKRSVSLPPDLTRRIAEEAGKSGMTFSGWLADTAWRRLKLDAGRKAVEEFERQHGPIPAEVLTETRRKIDATFAAQAAATRPRRRTG